MSKSDKKKSLRAIVQNNVEKSQLQAMIADLQKTITTHQSNINRLRNKNTEICEKALESLQHEEEPQIFITEFDGKHYQIVLPAKNNEEGVVEVFEAEWIK